MVMGILSLTLEIWIGNMGARQKILSKTGLSGTSVRELIEILETMPQDAKVTTDDDCIIDSVTLLWDMGDWVILNIIE